jgi:TRAP transporter TAXI family solute receptor
MKTMVIVRRILLIVLVAGCALSWGDLNSPAWARENITIVTASIGGAWYPIGGGIANIIKDNIPNTVSSVKTGGGISNIFNVGAGKAQIGLGFPANIHDAANGEADFKGKPYKNIRAITALYPGILHIAVSPKSGINSIIEAKGKILCVPKRGNTAEKVTQKVLDAYGLSYDSFKRVQFVGFSDAADLIRDGHADMLSAMSTVPFPALMDLAKTKGVKLLSIDTQVMGKILKANPAFFEYVIPGGSYEGSAKPTSALATTTLLFTRAEMPEELVYQITKNIFAHKASLVAAVKNLKQMTVESGTQTGGVPLHPGAKRFFDEQKKK